MRLLRKGGETAIRVIAGQAAVGEADYKFALDQNLIKISSRIKFKILKRVSKLSLVHPQLFFDLASVGEF